MTVDDQKLIDLLTEARDRLMDAEVQADENRCQGLSNLIEQARGLVSTIRAQAMVRRY